MKNKLIGHKIEKKPNGSFFYFKIALVLLLGARSPLARAEETNAVLESSTRSVAPAENKKPDLTDLPLPQLMDIIVTSPSRTEQPISKSAAAISVITSEDIRRSGATSIPELLRAVPGLDVGRVDSHDWAVSSRGFNDTFANKLLVMIDGRTVYTPLFSGVFWDVQDTVLEDIERIEVIRGPGASLWGANAVNGVINITTKTAEQTQGVLLSAGGGTEERGFGSVRYGGKINDETFFRIYGKYFDRDDSVRIGGGDGNDDWDLGRGGFRLDWQPSSANLFTLQGDAYTGEVDQTFRRVTPVAPYSFFNQRDTFDVSGGNILGRWSRTISDESSFSLQTYFDRTIRDTIVFREDRDTFDVDFQHRFHIGERNDVVWGGGYRNTGDKVGNSFDISLEPRERRTQLFSAFVQDEISLVESNLFLTIGSKLEHNDFTGFEIQPSIRLLWTPHEKHSVWASVSRAVRTPSRAEDDIRLNQGPGPQPGTLVSVFGDRSFESEELIAYELGYRVQATTNLSFDLATFYNDYQNLRSLPIGAPYFEASPTPHVTIPAIVANDLYGETYGAELSANWQALDWWKWTATYSYLQMEIHNSNSRDTTSEHELEGSSPHHQFSLRSNMNLPCNVELDTVLRYVDALPAQGVDSYVTMDARLGWHATKNLELSIVGQNLFDSHHLEFKPTTIATQPGEVERGVYGKVTWRF